MRSLEHGILEVVTRPMRCVLSITVWRCGILGSLNGNNIHFINCDSYNNCDSLTSSNTPGNDGYGFAVFDWVHQYLITMFILSVAEHGKMAMMDL